MSILSKLRSGSSSLVLAIIALYFAYRLYIWRKYDQLIRQSGLPVLELIDKRWFMRPIGNFMRQLENWHRIYDSKHDCFKSAGMPFTVVAPAPIWSELLF